MASSPPGELEDLTLCSCCKRAFDEDQQQPKVLSCKHHFCLKCISTVLLKGRELYCIYCWKRTELPDARPEALPTHGALLALARRLAAGALPPPAPAPGAGADECPAHGLPASLWCGGCGVSLCHGCGGHAGHAVRPAAEARAALRRDVTRDLHHTHRLLDDLQRLVFKQRDFLLKILEATTTLKTQLETELVNNPAGFEVAEAREALESARRALGADARPSELRALLAGLAADRERLQARHRDMFLQCRLDDLIRGARVALDFDLLKRALADVHASDPPPPDDGYRNPVLFLANYCMSQLYSRHCLMKRQDALAHNGTSDLPQSFASLAIGKQSFDGGSLKSSYAELTNNNSVTGKPSPLGFGDVAPGSPAGGKSLAFQTESLSLALPNVALSPQPLMRNPSSHTFPLYYFNIEVNGSPFGRVVIEVRSDVAPKMARNFSLLTTGDLGIGYKGCAVFQCWENESVITGDFELNNGRGGRSVFEESFFMPDDTKMVAVRGSVGMRRSQKRHDNLGLVGSQFRIILREMRGFTGIFAFVAEGLDLVDRLSQTGDSAGKPHSSILIASCGKLNSPAYP